MVMIFEKKIDAFANVVWWSTYQQILKGIGQPCFRAVLHGFLIDKLLTRNMMTFLVYIEYQNFTRIHIEEIILQLLILFEESNCLYKCLTV
jgi:hypothetical protein